MLEKGKLEYLNARPKENNRFFNEADRQIEDLHAHLASRALSYLINPEIAPYRPEDFEKVTIHYYKSLNYCALQAYNEALVEAKRTHLELRKINEKYPEGGEIAIQAMLSPPLILQGLIYEATANSNDAFISYRNAVELYESHPDVPYYCVTLPKQLKKDLIRTANPCRF